MLGRPPASALVLLAACAAAGSVVSVSPAAALPACAPKALRVSLTIEGNVLAVAPTLMIRTTGRRCRLRGRALLAIVDTPEVTGNPAAANVNAVLDRRYPGRVTWNWRNWCGDSRRFSLTVSVGKKRATAATTQSPFCALRDQPSVLEALG